MAVWDRKAVMQMAQGVAGYSDVQRLAGDVEEVVRELKSLVPKVDRIGTCRAPFLFASLCVVRQCHPLSVPMLW